MNPNNQKNKDKNSHFEDIFDKMTDKADKIYHAIFLLSKYVSHKNMTDRLQYIGIDFLEMSYMLHPRETDHHKDIVSEISYLLKELKTLTHGLVIQGILSSESKTLFDHEIDSFIKNSDDYVYGYEEHLSQAHGVVSPIFDQGFFGEQFKFLPPSDDGLSSKKLLSYSTHSESMSDSKGPKLTDKKTSVHSLIGQKISHKSIGHLKKADVDTSKNSTKSNRKLTILSFIKNNTKSHTQSSLKDILNHVGDCSEKTIQRELNDLIKDGYLRKEGDRRWSRYFFLKDME